MNNEDCTWHLGVYPSSVLHPIVCLSFGRGVWRRMSDYEKAVQAMEWLRENTFTHYIDDESGFRSKENGGKFFVRIESSETVNGLELIEMAKELGWEE